ncbi:hypothetical protein [Streptomyces rhizosphaerihabitans]|uniref:hypothetical protein n=1 Tax=Streptomyces rhizosphaerihabitans TaxID=1266770 RepID=UPI0021C1AF05|nr:hypothetical protein [Streptomyces rhizosphaerihabitans]MCT9011122.1 hypothetical protein [Streptomyces rhizosphaerihabitans]
MGVYLVSVGAREWFGEDEDEDQEDEDQVGFGELASALNAELLRRGLPPYTSLPEETPFVRGSGMAFEEKLIPPMDGFTELCRAHLSQEETDTLCGWSALVPISLDEEICLPVEFGYTDETMVAGAPQVLAIVERLARIVDLPPEIPATSDNLDLTMWFRDGPAKDTAAARPGPWAEDLDAAFYVALYLRAAQFVLRRGSPVVYS